MVLHGRADLRRQPARWVDLRRRGLVLRLDHREEIGEQRLDLRPRHPLALVHLAPLGVHLEQVDLPQIGEAHPRCVIRHRHAGELGEPPGLVGVGVNLSATALDQMVEHLDHPELPGDALGAARLDREGRIGVDDQAQVAPGHLEDLGHLVGVGDLVAPHDLPSGAVDLQAICRIGRFPCHSAAPERPKRQKRERPASPASLDWGIYPHLHIYIHCRFPHVNHVFSAGHGPAEGGRYRRGGEKHRDGMPRRHSRSGSGSRGLHP